MKILLVMLKAYSISAFSLLLFLFLTQFITYVIVKCSSLIS